MSFEQFRFTDGAKLSDYQSDYDNGQSKAQLKHLHSELMDELSEYQERLYAQSKQSLLLVFQAMDAAGKDSTIAKLTRGLGGQGCHVHSFKAPTKLELKHDFLWRVHDKVPAQGELCLFNRSHYEDVLIVKVHGWASDEQIELRYQHINNFESLLADRGTKVIKFMLNVSPDYQLKRFQRRLDNNEKHWKFNPGDLEERAHWDDYMEAFEKAMSKSSPEQSPWYVVPAENRPFRDVMVASVVLEALKEMDPQYPAPDFDIDDYQSGSLR